MKHSLGAHFSGECGPSNAPDGFRLQADAEEARGCVDIFDAAKERREGAVRHFLSKKPERVKKADHYGGEARALAVTCVSLLHSVSRSEAC